MNKKLLLACAALVSMQSYAMETPEADTKDQSTEVVVHRTKKKKKSLRSKDIEKLTEAINRLSENVEISNMVTALFPRLMVSGILPQEFGEFVSQKRIMTEEDKKANIEDLYQAVMALEERITKK